MRQQTQQQGGVADARLGGFFDGVGLIMYLTNARFRCSLD
jgi:hypothetical protein